MGTGEVFGAADGGGAGAGVPGGRRDPVKHFYEIVHAAEIHPGDGYADDRGYIAWRRGTGDNVELTHLYAWPPRQGHGRRLLVRMLEALRARPPYSTVYGFTRCSPNGAGDFYRAVGFRAVKVFGVYDEGWAVVFSARYEGLLAFHGLAPLTKEAT